VAGRVAAAVYNKWNQVPVNFQNYDNEDQEYADVQADNAIASWSELSIKGINCDLQTLDPGFDLEMLGIKDFELEPADKYKDKDEDAVPEEVEPKTKLGDLYQLGEHRLYCGDATDKQCVEYLMGGEKADMVFTDPPYGVDYSGGIQFTKEGVKQDQRKKLANDHSEDIYTNSVPIMAKYSNGPIYTWYADCRGRQLYNAIAENGVYHAMIVWVKNGGYGALNASYKQKHEPCVFWKPKDKTLLWCGPTTENTIWEMDKDGKNKLHPTQKPVALAERAIKNHTAKSVLDLFGGSGSTLIACEKTNRKCYMMELDPHYCDIIIKRYEDFTGKTAERV